MKDHNDLRLQEIHDKLSGGMNLSKLTFTYDLNGNMTDDGAGKVYAWGCGHEFSAPSNLR